MTLTEDEIHALTVAYHDDHCGSHCHDDISTYRPLGRNLRAMVEQIIAERIATPDQGGGLPS